jgi:hypothetical protein
MTDDDVIRRSDDFTREVAVGYPSSIHDYANALRLRTKVAELETGAVPLPADQARRIAESDLRFREASVELSAPFAGFQAPRSAWWWFRRPTKMGPELEADLARVVPREGTPIT